MTEPLRSRIYYRALVEAGLPLKRDLMRVSDVPHHAVCLERLQRILSEHAPQFERYRAEQDAAWPEWAGLPIEEVLSRLQALRKEIIGPAKGLTEAEASRIGIHPLFGEMSLALWLEFFLLHEAHHLYVVMTRLGQAKRSLNA